MNWNRQIEALQARYADCDLCPRQCHVNRQQGARGRCGMGAEIIAARAGLHAWEEPCISGRTGSGTVFFCGCNLGCVYCQNAAISAPAAANTPLPADWRSLTPDALSEVFLRLQEQGAGNINLVTPTHFAPGIAAAILHARQAGLAIPTLWNSSGYESASLLRQLEGLIDIYLVDDKYGSASQAARYSAAPDYAAHCREAIAEMVRQTGPPVFVGGLSAEAYNALDADYDGPLMQRGTIVRHLVLPGQRRILRKGPDGVSRLLPQDSLQVVESLLRDFGPSVYISLMSQYVPGHALTQEQYRDRFPELLQRVDPSDYEALVDHAIACGIENGFFQGEGADDESFIPAFDGEGL